MEYFMKFNYCTPDHFVEIHNYDPNDSDFGFVLEGHTPEFSVRYLGNNDNFLGDNCRSYAVRHNDDGLFYKHVFKIKDWLDICMKRHDIDPQCFTKYNKSVEKMAEQQKCLDLYLRMCKGDYSMPTPDFYQPRVNQDYSGGNTWGNAPQHQQQHGVVGGNIYDSNGRIDPSIMNGATPTYGNGYVQQQNQIPQNPYLQYQNQPQYNNGYVQQNPYLEQQTYYNNGYPQPNPYLQYQNQPQYNNGYQQYNPYLQQQSYYSNGYPQQTFSSGYNPYTGGYGMAPSPYQLGLDENQWAVNTINRINSDDNGFNMNNLNYGNYYIAQYNYNTNDPFYIDNNMYGSYAGEGMYPMFPANRDFVINFLGYDPCAKTPPTPEYDEYGFEIPYDPYQKELYEEQKRQYQCQVDINIKLTKAAYSCGGEEAPSDHELRMQFDPLYRSKYEFENAPAQKTVEEMTFEEKANLLIELEGQRGKELTAMFNLGLLQEKMEHDAIMERAFKLKEEQDKLLGVTDDPETHTLKYFLDNGYKLMIDSAMYEAKERGFRMAGRFSIDRYLLSIVDYNQFNRRLPPTTEFYDPIEETPDAPKVGTMAYRYYMSQEWSDDKLEYEWNRFARQEIEFYHGKRKPREGYTPSNIDIAFRRKNGVIKAPESYANYDGSLSEEETKKLELEVQQDIQRQQQILYGVDIQATAFPGFDERERLIKKIRASMHGNPFGMTFWHYNERGERCHEDGSVIKPKEIQKKPRPTFNNEFGMVMKLTYLTKDWIYIEKDPETREVTMRVDLWAEAHAINDEMNRKAAEKAAIIPSIDNLDFVKAIQDNDYQYDGFDFILKKLDMKPGQHLTRDDIDYHRNELAKYYARPIHHIPDEDVRMFEFFLDIEERRLDLEEAKEGEVKGNVDGMTIKRSENGEAVIKVTCPFDDDGNFVGDSNTTTEEKPKTEPKKDTIVEEEKEEKELIPLITFVKDPDDLTPVAPPDGYDDGTTKKDNADKQKSKKKKVIKHKISGKNPKVVVKSKEEDNSNTDTKSNKKHKDTDMINTRSTWGIITYKEFRERLRKGLRPFRPGKINSTNMYRGAKKKFRTKDVTTSNPKLQPFVDRINECSMARFKRKKCKLLAKREYVEGDYVAFIRQRDIGYEYRIDKYGDRLLYKKDDIGDGNNERVE